MRRKRRWKFTGSSGVGNITAGSLGNNSNSMSFGPPTAIGPGVNGKSPKIPRVISLSISDNEGTAPILSLNIIGKSSAELLKIAKAIKQLVK